MLFSFTCNGLDMILSLGQQGAVVAVDEEFIAMSFETAAYVVGIILLQILEEGDMETAKLLDVHEDFLSERKGRGK